MVERLRASFLMTRQFSTDVSHELRTPLTALRGELEVALFTAESVDQYQEAITNALQDIERLSQIIRALLLLSQAESGQLVLQKTVLDLSGIMRDIVEQFQIPAEAGGLTLTSDLPPVCLVEADRIQIERMLYNLLSNALKYTGPGGRVHVSLRAGEGTVALAVEDSGRGIAPDHLPHIFDRFYRVPIKDRGDEKSLGLGLSFVAWIVKAHGGRIDVRSEPGRGTRFDVRLPVGGVAAAELQPQGEGS
jgi:signal transduction histidine kinase